MSCGCTKPKCSTTSTCSCSSCTSSSTNCATVCTALVVSNSWNVPACGASAILSVAGLTTVLIGSYVYSPSYGWFRISAFDSVNAQITVVNDCLSGNASPGSVVPALTTFIFGAPPAYDSFAFVITNAWAVPACAASVVLDTAGLETVLIGSYIWLSGYGYFRITAFDSINQELTVVNDCTSGNAAPGTAVPTTAEFTFGNPPATSIIDSIIDSNIDTLFAFTTWVPTVTPVAPMTFTGSPTILSARYLQVGKLVMFMASFTVVVNVAGSVINLSLPVTAVSQGLTITTQITNNSQIVAGTSSISTVNSIDLRLAAVASYTPGIVGPTVYGFYEAA